MVGALGAFAGLYALDEERLLVASTDGVGSKLVLARRAGLLRWCGIDLAAHCVNDVLTTGADPLVLLDYVAASRIDEAQVAELVEGMAEVCREAGSQSWVARPPSFRASTGRMSSTWPGRASESSHVTG